MRRCGRYFRYVSLLAFCLTVVSFACDENSEGGPEQLADLVLTADPAELSLVPGGLGSVNFRLTDKGGRPRSSTKVGFSLLGPAVPQTDEPGIAGASLLASQGATDGQGRFLVTVRAGALGRFRLRASYSGGPDMLVPVTVARQKAGRAEATVAVVGTATPASIDMRLHPGVPCAQLSVTTPTPQQSQFVHKMGVAGRWSLPALQVDQNYGLVAKALDQAGALIGFGCVPIDGNQLLQAATVTFVVPLPEVAVSFGKKFEAASELLFAPELAKGAKAVADAWGKLSQCPRDPAQIWLDCTLDALGPQGAANAPLDCVPESDEGPLGLLLAAKRGVFTAARPACRGDTDRGGQASADGQVFALFATPTSPERAALPDLAKAAAGLFASIRFSSTLEFSASGKARTWLVTHTVKGLGFPVGNAFHSVPMGERPGKTSRFAVGTLNEKSEIVIASHGFGLNLGEAAHAAFRARLFAAQGFPEDEAAFLGKVLSQAQLTSGASSTVGCAAVDALLCPQLAQSAGCLQGACERGLAALAKTLTAGFEALASDDLDLFLQGSASLTDRAPDGTVQGLGSLVLNRGGGPGTWSGELRGQGGVSPVRGLWVAISQRNQPGSM